jgi:hypothetical protein
VKRCKKFPSQEYAASKARRLRRIDARATPELSQTFAAGRLTLRRYDILSRLPSTKQRAIIAQQEQETARARLAAETINAVLDDTKSSDIPVRLAEIAAGIYEAVQSARLI